jgi:hypothetical protein
MKNNQHGHNVHYVNNNYHMNANYPAYNSNISNSNNANNSNGNVKTNSNYNRPLNQYQSKGPAVQTQTSTNMISYAQGVNKNVNPPHRPINNNTNHAKHAYSNINQQQTHHQQPKQTDQSLHHLSSYQHHTQPTSPTSTHNTPPTSYGNINNGSYQSLERKNSYPFNHKQHQQSSQHHNTHQSHSHHLQPQHYQYTNNHQYLHHQSHHAYQKQTSLQENSRKSTNTLLSHSLTNENLSTQTRSHQQETQIEQEKENKLKDQQQINSIVDYLHRVDLNSKQNLMVPSSSKNESVSSSSNNIETSDCESYEHETPSTSSITIASTPTPTSISTTTPTTTSITTTRMSTASTSNADLNEVFSNDENDMQIGDFEDLIDSCNHSPEETRSFDTLKIKDLVNQTDYVNRFKYYNDYVLAVDQLYPNTKWPLHDSWTFWYIKNDSNSSWENNLKKLIEVAYIEDFWSVVNYVYSPSRITSHGDIIFFKNGIRPMWEDVQNSDGGSWLFQIQSGGQHKKSNEEIFQYWLDTMLNLIGDCFCDNEMQKKHDLNEESDRQIDSRDEHLCEFISGFYASPRAKMHKLALWTRNYKNEKKTRLIG